MMFYRSYRIAMNTRQAYGLMAGVLLLGAIIRLIGPVSMPALGQSDAYAHLQFLNDWLAAKSLRHSYYPTGYFWLVGMPASVLQAEAYWIARYVGVVWGCLTIVTVFVLTRRAFGYFAGLWAAFLVAAFPAFSWLQKTGVGMYPSQAGIVLVPLLLWSWDHIWTGALKKLWAVFIVSVLLAWTVPMMLIDLLPFLMIDVSIRCGRKELPRKAKVALGSIVAVGLLSLIVLMGVIGIERVTHIAQLVAGVENKGDASLRSLFDIVGLFLLPVRGLPAGLWPSLAALLVGIMLLGIALRAWTMHPAARMIALWALYTWAQSVFGFCQFPLYMRAGWFLLMALAMLGGWMAVGMLKRISPKSRYTVTTALILTSGLSFVFPPTPVPHLSPAENDLVRVLRDLQAWSQGKIDESSPEWLSHLNAQQKLIVWSRIYNASPGYQGDPVYAFLEKNPSIELRLFDDALMGLTNRLEVGQHVFLLDDQSENRISLGLMEAVNPALVASLRHAQERFMRGARALRKLAQEAESEATTVQRVIMPEGLEVVVVLYE